MIGYLHGKAEIIATDYVIIECSGIGYKVFMSTNDIAVLTNNGESVRVYTSMYIREDIIALYGFLNQEDLRLFELLITISGIGPKAAISIFSVMTGNDLKFAVLSDDVTTICKAPGIGKKTAQKLILELKDKFSLDSVFEERFDAANVTGSVIGDEFAAALEALVSLGYSATEAKQALNKCKDKNADADKLIKEALRFLF